MLLAQIQLPVQPTVPTADTTFHLPHVEYSLLLPEFIVIGGALLLLLFSAVVVRRNRTSFHTVITLRDPRRGRGPALVPLARVLAITRRG